MKYAHVALLLIAAGCGGKLTEIVLVVDSDIAPSVVDSIHIAVTGPSMMSAVDTVRPYNGAPPLTLSLLPRGSVLQPVTITVDGEKSGTIVVSRKIVTGFDDGVQRVLHVRLFHGCIGGTCPTDQTCDERGLCVPTMVMSSSLPAWTGKVIVTELCNGYDDDGDGVADNGFDLMTNAAHCGSCTNACPAGQTCTAAACSTGSIVKVAVGTQHACALRSTGGIACWGQNPNAELGAGDTSAYHVPVSVVGVTDAIDVSCGYGFSCAVRRGGQVLCWGANEAGESGQTDTSMSVFLATAVPGVTNGVEVTTGDTHSCARLMSGATMCWGANTDGRLGAGSGSMMAPVMVSGLMNATTVHVGEGHACVVRTDLSIACWGSNESGELGDTTVTPRPMPVQVHDGMTGMLVVPMASSASATEGEVDAGNQFSCAVLSTGVACWGSNSSGEVGLPDGTDWMPAMDAPVRVTGTSGAAAVSLAGASVGGQEGCNGCALMNDGSVSCWGCNSLGELGDGTTMPRHTAAPLAATPMGPLRATQIAVGSHTACAVANDAAGSVWCWGDGANGQLGNGMTTGFSSTPVRVMGL